MDRFTASLAQTEFKEKPKYTSEKNLHLMHKGFWSKFNFSISSVFASQRWLKPRSQTLQEALCSWCYTPNAVLMDIIFISIATTCSGTVDDDFWRVINNSRQNPQGTILFSHAIKDPLSRGIRRKSTRKYNMDADFFWKQIAYFVLTGYEFLNILLWSVYGV